MLTVENARSINIAKADKARRDAEAKAERKALKAAAAQIERDVKKELSKAGVKYFDWCNFYITNSTKGVVRSFIQFYLDRIEILWLSCKFWLRWRTLAFGECACAACREPPLGASKPQKRPSYHQMGYKTSRFRILVSIFVVISE